MRRYTAGEATAAAGDAAALQATAEEANDPAVAGEGEANQANDVTDAHEAT